MILADPNNAFDARDGIERRSTLATILKSASHLRHVHRLSAEAWLLSMLDDHGKPTPKNPNCDEMVVLAQIAIGWVWGYHAFEAEA